MSASYSRGGYGGRGGGGGCYGRRGGGGSGGGSHPSGLRGKAIGMYYRDRAREKRQEEPELRLGPSVSVPPSVLSRVNECLKNFDEREEDDEVSQEFARHFRHLLSVDFEGFIAEAKASATIGGISNTDNEALNERLKSDLLSKDEINEFRDRYKDRLSLPTMQQGEKIIKAVKEHQVVLIVGSTGCGKTTQVPQILLDDLIYNHRGAECRIVCTQPRRISAVSVAERVSYERCERLGQSVGYQIRLEGKMPRDEGSILYCTTGILLQKMQSDPLLQSLSIVILDEIHERNVESDLLMGLLKRILPHRPDLKVILMSATVREQDFSEYFQHCHTLHIHGTLFPVEVFYLEDILQETGFDKFQNSTQVAKNTKHGRWRKDRQQQSQNFEYSAFIEPHLRELQRKYDANVIQSLRCSDSEGCQNLQFVEHLIFYICEFKPPGAILVFLPGYDKISKLNALLMKPTQSAHNRLSQRIQVHPLHSMMPTVNQQSVFKRPAANCRKIILSTILAETSVTIDDVVYVINTGRTKLSNYNVEANIQTLDEMWVTKANTAQRKGRAGRVQPGICYNLFTRAREQQMDEAPSPEIVRTKLESVILNLKLLHIDDAYDFLSTLITKPNPASVRNGIALLKRIDALDSEGILTPLGMHLARLPINPQMGKMILMAALFRCLDPITSAAAALSYKQPFYSPLGLEYKVDAIKREMAGNSYSDHLMFHNVIVNYREAKADGNERDFCFKCFLSPPIMQQLENMKQQFADLLKGAKFIESSNVTADMSNVNSKNVPLVRAVIASGLYPNMAHMHKIRRRKNHVQALHSMSTPEEKRINFHPSSVNAGAKSFDSNYFVYFLKQKSTSTYILDASMIFPMAILIFGDGVKFARAPKIETTYISVAGCYNFKCDQETADIICRLRRRLDWLLQVKALNPSPIAIKSREEYLIKAIQILLSYDDPCYEDQYGSDGGDDDDYYDDDDDF